MNVLEAKITADISGLESGLKRAGKLQDDYAKSISNTQKDIADNIAISKQYEKAIEQLNQELKDGTISQKQFSQQLNRIKRDEKETQIETANLRKELTRLKRDQKDLASTSTATSKGMTSFGKSTANATPTVIEFSRVIQDAPYGIQGVANNIQQLTANFGYLKTQAGGTVPALKAFAGSFLGPAGIVFAVSTITSLLITFGDELLSSTSSTKKLAEATAQYVGEAKSEITALNTLVNIASDESNSKAVRQKALKEINDNYSDYLGNLDLESLKTDQVRKSIEKLTQSLILRAKVEGLQALITEKAKDASEDIIEAELERGEAYRRVNSEIDKAIKKNAFLQQALGDVKGEKEKIKAFIELANKYEDVRNASSGAILAIGEYKKASADAKGLNQDLDDSLTSLVRLQEGFKEGLFKTESDIVNIDEGAVIIEVKKAIEKGGEQSTVRPKVEPQLNTSGLSQGLDLSIFEGFSADSPEFKLPTINDEDFVARLERARQSAELFSDATKSAFSGLASSLSQSLNTGSTILDGFISSLISGFAEILAQKAAFIIADKGLSQLEIGTKQAKASGDGIAIATSAAAALGPAGAIALPGLIASQLAIINGAFAGVRAIGFASGGIVPGGSFNGDQIPAFLNSGEVVLNGRQQAQVLMRIAEGNVGGRKDVSNENLVATTILRGQDQIVQIGRAKKHSKRFNG